MEQKTKKPKKVEEKKTETKHSEHAPKLLVVIRISGEVKKKPEVVDTLYRMRLRRKFTCILVKGNDKNMMGMIERAKHLVAYGPIERDTLEKLIKHRGQGIDNKKFNAGDVASEVMNGKSLSELGLKPFFRLHPPRGGIDSKIQFANGGVLGNNKEEINKLVERML